MDIDAMALRSAQTELREAIRLLEEAEKIFGYGDQYTNAFDECLALGHAPAWCTSEQSAIVVARVNDFLREAEQMDLENEE